MEVCWETRGRFLLHTGHPLGGAGEVTSFRPPCNLSGETCCKMKSTFLCCFGQCDLKEVSSFFECTSGALSVGLGLGAKWKYMSHHCPFFSLAVRSVGNCIMLKPTALLFSTALVGVQDRTSLCGFPWRVMSFTDMKPEWMSLSVLSLRMLKINQFLKGRGKQNLDSHLMQTDATPWK